MHSHVYSYVYIDAEYLYRGTYIGTGMRTYVYRIVYSILPIGSSNSARIILAPVNADERGSECGLQLLLRCT